MNIFSFYSYYCLLRVMFCFSLWMKCKCTPSKIKKYICYKSLQLHFLEVPHCTYIKETSAIITATEITRTGYFYKNTFRSVDQSLHPMRRMPWNFADRSFGFRVVSPTSLSLTLYSFRLQNETSASHLYTSFFQPWHEKVRYTCLYLCRRSFSFWSSVREMSRRRNDRKS